MLTEVDPGMDIMNEEALVPAAPICKVSSLDEAIELANKSRFGLGSTIYTTNLDEAMRAVNGIETAWSGSMHHYSITMRAFGGRKMTEWAGQLGAEGLDTFRHTKLAMIDPAANDQISGVPYKTRRPFPVSSQVTPARISSAFPVGFDLLVFANTTVAFLVDLFR